MSMLKIVNAVSENLIGVVDPDHREAWYRQRRALESGDARPASGKYSKWLRERGLGLARQVLETGLRRTPLYARGVANAEALTATELDMYLDGLPGEFDGYRLLHITDCHFDCNPGLLRRLRTILHGQTVDLCVFTGDYQDNRRSAECSEEAATALSELVAAFEQRDGVLAVLGNHDRADIVDPLEARGVRVLANEHVSLARNRDSIVVTGLDDVYHFETPTAYKALADAPEGFRIAIVHSPDAAQAAAFHGHDLYLCGHTHGGQIALPGGRPVVTGHDGDRRHSSGRWACGQMAGYTNRGAGASMLPIRFNAPPEVAFITLRCFKGRLG